jgi:hypothetical protein
MKYATFDENGVLNARYDSEINTTIPDGATELSDELFFRTMNEVDGIWKLVDGAVTKTPFPAKSAETLIAAAHARINRIYEAAVNALTAGYPQNEIDSWAKQETEARAWLDDNAYPTPWIDAAAAARGILKVELIGLIIGNADALAPMHGALTGKRQSLRDAIDALGPTPTQQQLDSIVW